MYMRLAFSVAAHLDPEILLLDEVLSVGDATFQEKSLARIDEITRSGRTVLFVSHDAASVANLCQRALYLKDGRPEFVGPVDDALEQYLGRRPQLLIGGGRLDDARRDGTGGARIRSALATDDTGGTELYPDEPIVIRAELEVSPHVDLTAMELELALASPVSGHLIGLATPLSSTGGVREDPYLLQAECRLEELPLKAGSYILSLAIVRGSEVIDRVLNQVELSLLGSRTPNGLRIVARSSPILVRHAWVLQASTAPASIGEPVAKPQVVAN
jgi:lipopolysaccharide transport system ATP-binding protein